MPRRLLLPICMTTAVAALAAAPMARAGTYDVYSCWAGHDSFRNPNANASAWAKINDNVGGQYSSFDQCGTHPNGMGVISVGGYEAPAGRYGEVAFSAPPGTRVQAVQLWRTAWSRGTGSGGDSKRNFLRLLADGAQAPQGDAFDGSNEVPDGAAGTTDEANFGVIPANAMTADLSSATPSAISYRVGCSFSVCPTGDSNGSFAAGVKIHGAIVTLRDTSEPEMSVAGSGLLAAGEHKGVETVHVDFAKDNTGIKRLAVFNDDNTSPIGVVDYERNPDKCAWWQAIPCQDVSGVDIPVDTKRVSDGDHKIVVRAYDSAENARTVTLGPVTVRNGSPATPTSFSNGIGRGATNGFNATDTAVLTAWFGRNKRGRLLNPFARYASIRGRLTDTAGIPVNAAEVVIANRAAPGAPEVPIGVAQTDPTGGFRFLLPARGTTRQVVISYRSHLGDPTPVAVKVLGLRVRAGVRLKVHPHHVRNGDAITFRGRLLGGPVPRAGKLIDMQVRIGRRWHTFATTRANARGRFAHRYRFTRSYERIRYRFRALARAEAAYPYATGGSNSVSVRVN
jgi:hypothetical protein